MIASMASTSSRSTWFSMNDMPAVARLHGPTSRILAREHELEVVDGDAFDPLSGLHRSSG